MNYIWPSSHEGIPSGMVSMTSDSGYNSSSAGTAYGYRSAEDYGADYGMFGRITDKFFGTNHAAESAAALYNAEVSNKYNSDEAEKNRRFEEYMSSTAYQRMMQDAKKAGINPYYLIQNSSGSSSPAGSAASSSGSPNLSGNHKKGSSALGNLATTALAIAKIAAILAA